MKEFSILVRQGSGTPYILQTYPDIISAKKAVENLVNFEEERNRMYFVDNDYFFNKYCNVSTSLKYICIRVREVTKWEKYYEKVSEKPKTDNIFYMDNYFKKS